jgi:hypothetical protein
MLPLYLASSHHLYFYLLMDMYFSFELMHCSAYTMAIAVS